jgi:hypothetical protein
MTSGCGPAGPNLSPSTRPLKPFSISGKKKMTVNNIAKVMKGILKKLGKKGVLRVGPADFFPRAGADDEKIDR